MDKIVSRFRRNKATVLPVVGLTYFDENGVAEVEEGKGEEVANAGAPDIYFGVTLEEIEAKEKAQEEEKAKKEAAGIIVETEEEYDPDSITLDGESDIENQALEIIEKIKDLQKSELKLWLINYSRENGVPESTWKDLTVPGKREFLINRVKINTQKILDKEE